MSIPVLQLLEQWQMIKFTSEICIFSSLPPVVFELNVKVLVMNY